MKWVIIIVIILAALAAVALIATALKRKKEQAARERASELRSDAAQTASAKHQEEARAREAEAEAELARAQADKLDARATQERTSYDATRAQQEDVVREADRLDPDVDHRSSKYQPDLNGSPTHREDKREPRTWSQQQSGGSANPVPHGPETTGPKATGPAPGHEDDLAAWEREQGQRDQI